MSKDIRTYTGRHLNPIFVTPFDLCIEDIAHALSLVCRWAGHSRIHYSVALHSLVVAELVRRNSLDQGWTLWGLLHDAAEAYIGDMAKPVKNQMPEFRKVEANLMAEIRFRFNLPLEPCIVKEMDWTALLMEAEQLFDGRRDPASFGEISWPEEKLDDACKQIFFPRTWGLIPSGLFWKWLTPARVEKKFLKTFYALTKNSSPA